MTLEERTSLVLGCARVLYVNGQSTNEIVGAAGQLGSALGLRTTIIPRWGALEVLANGDTRLVSAIEADPTGVDMDRVAATMRAIDDLSTGRLAPTSTMDT